MNKAHGWMKVPLAAACSHWGWKPDAFWAATPLEIKAILDGMALLRNAQNPDGFDAGVAADLRVLLNQQQKT